MALPPKAVPFHVRPVTSWKGRVEISSPAAATPTTTLTPQPLWAASRAALWKHRDKAIAGVRELHRMPSSPETSSEARVTEPLKNGNKSPHFLQVSLKINMNIKWNKFPFLFKFYILYPQWKWMNLDCFSLTSYKKKKNPPTNGLKFKTWDFKVLEENIREILTDTGTGNLFWVRFQTTQEVKAETNRLSESRLLHVRDHQSAHRSFVKLQETPKLQQQRAKQPGQGM